MSKIALEGNASGTGTFTIASPNSNSNYTLTLPSSTGTVVVTGGAQTIEFAAGSAAAPSITFTGDTNTGIFSPGADTIAFSEGGVEAMRIDSSGNVGIGTSSPSGKLNISDGTSCQVNINSAAAGATRQILFSTSTNTQEALISSNNATGELKFESGRSGTSAYFQTFYTNNTERMRIDSGGNVGIGTSTTTDGGLTITTSVTRDNSWDAKLALQSTGANDFPALFFSGCSSTSRYGGIIQTASTSGNTGPSVSANIAFPITSATTCDIAFATNGNIGTTNATERMRITSGGYFKASNSGTYLNSSANYHEVYQTASDWLLRFTNSHASDPYGPRVDYTGAAPNNTANNFFTCSDSATLRMSVRSNGGIANYQANDVNLSDRREKTNFAPAKNYLDTICAIPVQTFNYIDQNNEEDPGLTLGVVAQDVQAVAPELVMESNWATKDEEPKMRLSIYQTDFQYALMKSIQELKAITDAQATRIEALEAEVAALKGQ